MKKLDPFRHPNHSLSAVYLSSYQTHAHNRRHQYIALYTLLSEAGQTLAKLERMKRVHKLPRRRCEYASRTCSFRPAKIHKKVEGVKLIAGFLLLKELIVGSNSLKNHIDDKGHRLEIFVINIKPALEEKLVVKKSLGSRVWPEHGVSWLRFSHVCVDLTHLAYDVLSCYGIYRRMLAILLSSRVSPTMELSQCQKPKKWNVRRSANSLKSPPWKISKWLFFAITFSSSPIVVDYLEFHALHAPITAQLSPTLRGNKRDKKKARWRACADKYRSKKEHRTQDESDLRRHNHDSFSLQMKKNLRLIFDKMKEILTSVADPVKGIAEACSAAGWRLMFILSLSSSGTLMRLRNTFCLLFDRLRTLRSRTSAPRIRPRSRVWLSDSCMSARVMTSCWWRRRETSSGFMLSRRES